MYPCSHSSMRQDISALSGETPPGAVARALPLPGEGSREGEAGVPPLPAAGRGSLGRGGETSFLPAHRMQASFMRDTERSRA